MNVVVALTNRLENATTSTERIETLKELQKLSKLQPIEVGKSILHLVFSLLRENGEIDEYSEALELITKLIKTKVENASKLNTLLILNEIINVELLLDLLEHEDSFIGVMSSEILTTMHSVACEQLEKSIQECPAGLTKLLNRMPDRSHEEVSNQAIILIRELTSTNEEMKKTVAFNEGFETIFGIIESEGSHVEPGAVVQDCLQICLNVLDGSEICQRLFYGMGGGWYRQLIQFFTPSILESYSKPTNFNKHKNNKNDDNNNDGSSDDDDNNLNSQHIGLWYEQNGRLKCAILAMETILCSLGTISTPTSYSKFYLPIIDELYYTLLHWIVRNGPSEMILLSFKILEHFIITDKKFAIHLFQYLIKYTPSIPGLHVPITSHSTSLTLQFSMKLNSSSDRRIISLTNLLIERYIYVSYCWYGHDETSREREIQQELKKNDSLNHRSLYMIRNEYWSGSLRILQKLLESDELTSGMVIQHILAPPPPLPFDDNDNNNNNNDDDDDDDFNMNNHNNNRSNQNYMENSLLDFGSIVFSLLLNSIEKIAAYSNATGLPPNIQGDISIIVRCSNILTLLLIHGGLLACELCTALSTHHLVKQRSLLDTSFHIQSLQQQPNHPILPYLLSLCSRIIRLPSVGFTILSSILKVLTAATNGCERATTQILEDPSNFFIVEMATKSSESAGVPLNLQVLCCLFLGTCFDSFPPPKVSNDSTNENTFDIIEPNRLSRKSILTMIDSKIGLSRFNDILKKPLQQQIRGSGPPSNNTNNNLLLQQQLPEDLFFIDTFKIFYVKQIEKIRSAIFDFYSGASSGNSNNDNLTPEGKIIQMQKELIIKLENDIEDLRSGNPISNEDNKKILNNQQEQQFNKDEINRLTELLNEAEKKNQEKDELILLLQNDLKNTKEKCDFVELKLNSQRETIESWMLTEEALMKEINELKQQNEKSKIEFNELNEKYTKLLQNQKNTIIPSTNQLISNTPAVGNLNDNNNNNNEEIMKYKEKIINLTDQKNKFVQEIETLNRKIKLLEEDLRTPMPHEKIENTKIVELEARNSTLCGNIWELESQISLLKTENQNLQNIINQTKSDINNNINTNTNINNSLIELEKRIQNLVNICDIESEYFMLPKNNESTDKIEEKLTNQIERIIYCIDLIKYVSGECSDYVIPYDILLNTDENSSLLRVLDVVKALNDKIHEYENILNDNTYLQNELEIKRNEIENMEDILKLSQESVEKLEKELKSKEFLENDNKLYREVIESLSKKLEEGQSINQNANIELSSKYQSLQSEATKLLEENKKLQEDLKQNQQNYIHVEYKLKTENKELKWKINQLEEKLNFHQKDLSIHTSNIPLLQEQIGLLTNENKELKSFEEQYEKNIEELESEINVKSSKVSSLQTQVNSLQNTNNELLNSLSQTQGEIKKLENKLSEVITNQNLDLDEKYHKLELKLEEQTRENNELKQRITNNEVDLRNLNSLINSLQDSNSNLTKSNQELEDEKEDIQRLNNELKTAIQTLKSENKFHLEEIELLKHRIEELEENERIQNEKFDKLSNETNEQINNLVNELDQSKNHELHLNSQLQNYQENVTKDSENFVNEIKKLQDLLNDEQNKVSILESDYNQQQEKITEFENYEINVTHHIKELENDLLDSKESYADLKHLYDELLEKVTESNEKLTLSHQLRKSFDDELKDISNKLKNQESINITLTNENKELKSLEEQYEKNIEELENKLENQSFEIVSLQTRYEEVVKELEKQNQITTELRLNNNTLKNQVENYANEMNQINKRLKEEIEEFKDRLKNEESINEGLRKENHSLTNENKELQNTIQESLKYHNEQLKSFEEQYEKNIEELENEKEKNISLENLVNKLKSEIELNEGKTATNLEEKLEELKNENLLTIQSLREDISIIQKENVDLNKIVEDKQKVIDELKKSFDDKLIDYNKLLEKYMKQKEQLNHATSNSTNSTLSSLSSSSTSLVTTITGVNSHSLSADNKEIKLLNDKIKKLEQNKQEILEEYNLQLGKLSGYQGIIHNLEKTVEKLIDEKEVLEESMNLKLKEAFEEINVKNQRIEKNFQEKHEIELKYNQFNEKFVTLQSENNLQVELVHKFIQYILRTYNSLSSETTSEFSDAIQKRTEELQQNNSENLNQYTVKQHLLFAKDFVKTFSEILQSKLEVIESKTIEVQELKKKIVELEENLKNFSKKTNLETPVKSNVNKKSLHTRSSPLNYSSPSATASLNETIAKLHSDLRREQRALTELREQHDDLLALLAQQEIELQVYQKHLYSIGGKEVFRNAKNETKTITNNKYGTYISYRHDGYTSVSESDQDEDIDSRSNDNDDSWNGNHRYNQQFQRHRVDSEEHSLGDTKVIL